MEHLGSFGSFESTDRFVDRHVGPNADDVATMLAAVGASSLAALMDEATPRPFGGLSRSSSSLPCPRPGSPPEPASSLR